MLNSLFKNTTKENEIVLGEKKVTVKKLTPAKWKELFSVVDNLPGLIIQVITSPQSDFYMTVIQAIDLAMDEVIKIVSVLTDIEEGYLKNNAGLDEIVEYITCMVEINRLDTTVKNLKSLLPKKQ